MSNNVEKIDISTKPIVYLDSKGNITEDSSYCKFALVNENQEDISKAYLYIAALQDDHYIVGDAVTIIDNKSNQTQSSTRYGVIRLSRDEKDNIIPYSEKIIVPLVYTSICESNSNTLICSNLNQCLQHRYTYVDIDPDSINYGRQLLPVRLTKAEKFDITYEGFAECEMHGDGRKKYIPRNCEPKMEISNKDLLTEDDVENVIHDTARVKMKKLTGGPLMATVPKSKK